MRLRGAMLLLCGLLIAERGFSGDAKEQEKLQGSWSFTKVSGGGTSENISKKLVFKGNTVRIIDAKGKAVAEGTYSVNPGQKPKTMDLTFEADAKKIETEAIYHLEGDTLKICHFKGGKGRPKEFVADEKTMLAVLKRDAK